MRARNVRVDRGREKYWENLKAEDWKCKAKVQRCRAEVQRGKVEIHFCGVEVWFCNGGVGTLGTEVHRSLCLTHTCAYNKV